MADNTGNLYNNGGLAAAERRVREMNDTARRYAAMSAATHTGTAVPPVSPVSPAPSGTSSPPASAPPRISEGDGSGGFPRNAGTLPFGINLPLRNIDTEKLLLSVLIILLASEGADIMLIAALVYIMM